MAKCCICGDNCSGKMKIRARSNKDYIFCTHCFNYYEETDIKTIRGKIKKNKLLIKDYKFN